MPDAEAEQRHGDHQVGEVVPLAGGEDLQQGDLEGEQGGGDQQQSNLLMMERPGCHSVARVNGTKRTGIRLLE